MFSDFQAFPFDQISLMTALRNPDEKPRLENSIDLGTALMTTAPPFMTNPDQIEQAHRIVAGLMAYDPITNWRFGLQHPPIEENGTAVDVARLQRLRQRGIAVMAVAYKGANALGGGFASEEGLTEEGKKFLDRLAETNIILDLSHANHRTSREVLEYSERQCLNLAVCATHGGCHSVYGHPRNLPDDVLLEISRRGGLIGLVTVPWMLSASDDTLDAVKLHLEHLLNLVSVDAICFGTDAIYRSLSAEEWAGLYQTLSGMLDSDGAFKARFPLQPEILQGPHLMATLYDWVTAQYSTGIADRICSSNLVQWFHKTA